MENTHINTKENTNKGCCNSCDSCKKEAAPSIVDLMLGGMLSGIAIQALMDELNDMPEAAPLDLLSKSDYKRLDAYLNAHYEPFREYIDENYVALLVALAQYEKVDFNAKIKAHIVHNIQNK